MQVKDIMTSDVAVCGWNTDLAAAAALMCEGGCSILPVVDESGVVVGVLTDGDICMALSTKPRPADRVTVREAVAKGVQTCRPDDTVAAALDLMTREQIRRLPVVDADGRLKGIVSLSDIARRALSGGDIPPERIVRAMVEISRRKMDLIPEALETESDDSFAPGDPPNK